MRTRSGRFQLPFEGTSGRLFGAMMKFYNRRLSGAGQKPHRP